MATTALKTAPRERIILGIDPGTNVMGYGVLKTAGSEAEMLAMGVIDLRRVADVYLKLGRIHERVMGLIEGFLPDELAIEAPFFGKNVQSMLKLGRAQGVAIAAAISRDIPIHEYAPMKIKQAITGNGNASKEQVAALMQRLLHIPDERMLPHLDATDALAAAYCHHLHTHRAMPGGGSGGGSWKSFLKNNPGRLRTTL
ncbi:MAG: crossover junction endodeoxyribonuclease RuvC [Bacteroidaceae bacterium]|nr:crossover junction endodeoxyribonuclease RuvC [Bacteroidaceae bacterium]